jgi:tetratricopeptide (TPR) repeat protein
VVDRAPQELVTEFERREKKWARVTMIATGMVIALALFFLGLVLMSRRETDVKQAQVDTLVTRVAAAVAVNDSLVRAQALRDSSTAVANSGASLAMQGHIAEAHETYRTAIAIDSTNWAAWDLEGTLYRRTNPGKAIPSLRRSIALNPANEWAFYNLSIALWNAGEHEAAIDSLARVLELAPQMRLTIRADDQFKEFRSSDRFVELVKR